MTSSTSLSSTTTGSTTQRPMFSIATIPSTESRTSGIRPSACSADTTAFRKPTFPSFSKRPNFASTAGHLANNCESSNAGPNSSLSQPDLGQPLKFSSPSQPPLASCPRLRIVDISIVSSRHKGNSELVDWTLAFHDPAADESRHPRPHARRALVPRAAGPSRSSAPPKSQEQELASRDSHPFDDKLRNRRHPLRRSGQARYSCSCARVPCAPLQDPAQQKRDSFEARKHHGQ
jgi:hypothetical protein